MYVPSTFLALDQNHQMSDSLPFSLYQRIIISYYKTLGGDVQTVQWCKGKIRNRGGGAGSDTQPCCLHSLYVYLPGCYVFFSLSMSGSSVSLSHLLLLTHTTGAFFCGDWHQWKAMIKLVFIQYLFYFESVLNVLQVNWFCLRFFEMPHRFFSDKFNDSKWKQTRSHNHTKDHI